MSAVRPAWLCMCIADRLYYIEHVTTLHFTPLAASQIYEHNKSTDCDLTLPAAKWLVRGEALSHARSATVHTCLSLQVNRFSSAHSASIIVLSVQGLGYGIDVFTFLLCGTGLMPLPLLVAFHFTSAT